MKSKPKKPKHGNAGNTHAQRGPARRVPVFVRLDPAAEESAAYLANWIAAIKGDNKLVTIAAAQAQKAADYILGRLEEAQGGAA